MDWLYGRSSSKNVEVLEPAVLLQGPQGIALWGQGQALIELHVPDVAVFLRVVADLPRDKGSGRKKTARD